MINRIDKLEDAVDSEWMKNRFRVDTISTIAHWGNPENPPASTTVNLNYCTNWMLGIKGDQFGHTGDIQNEKINLGYYAASYMNLIGEEHKSGESNEDASLTMHHTYKVSLLPPGKGLVALNEEDPSPKESEGMMQKDEQQMIKLDDTEAGNGEIGTLSLITQRRIRRAYL